MTAAAIPNIPHETSNVQEDIANWGQPDNLPLTSEEQQFANAAPPANQQPAESFGKKLKNATLAVKLERSKWGITRKLDRGQVQKAASEFNADTDRLSASKKLIDTNSKEYRACTQTIGKAVQYWKDVTVPFPEKGIRLIRRDRMPMFTQQLEALKAELAENVTALQASLATLIETSRVKLGELFNESDYPDADELAAEFGLEYSNPTISPDPLLKQLDAQLFEQQQARIQAKFDEAVKLAEDAFIDEFSQMITKIADRMQPGDDGKPKLFFDAYVNNLCGFFEKFKDLNIGSNQELEGLIEEAKQIVKGDKQAIDAAATIKNLRGDVTARAHFGKQFEELGAKIQAQLITKPRRKFALDANALADVE